MVILNGETADADDVRGVFSLSSEVMSFNDHFGPYSAIRLNKFQSKVFRLDNASWATTTTGMTTSAASGEYYKDDNAVYTLTSYEIPILASDSKVTIIPHYDIFKLYDECDDSSINGSLWTKVSGTNGSEDTDSLTLNNINSVYRTNDLAAETDIFIHYNAVATGSDNALIRLSDGTNHSSVVSVAPSSGQETERGYLHMKIGSGKVFVNKKSVRIVGENILHFDDFIVLDTSAWGANLYVRLETVGTTDNLINIFYVRLGLASPSTTVTNAISRNSGSNYTNMTNRFHTNTDSGDSVILRSTGTVASNEVLAFRGWTIYEELA